jgi:hypothetical protein
MRQAIRITTPFPTTEEVARKLGVSPARTRELVEMVAQITADRREEKRAIAKRGSRNGGFEKHRQTGSKIRPS